MKDQQWEDLGENALSFIDDMFSDESDNEETSTQPEHVETPGEEVNATDQEETEIVAEEATDEESSDDEDLEVDQDKEDEFTKLDPNSLSEELLPYYKSMQKDYLEKTRALAEQRKEVENISNAVQENIDDLKVLFGEEVENPSDYAAAALEYSLALWTDPEVAVNTYQQLGQLLSEAGYDVNAQVSSEEAEKASSEDEPSSEILALKQELENIKNSMSVKEQQEYEAQQKLQEEQEAKEAIESFLSEIDTLKASPEFKDFNDDVWETVEQNAVFESYQTGGRPDPLAAAKKMRSIIDAARSDYIRKKTSQPSIAAGGVTTTSPVSAPTNMKEAQQAALDFVERMEF